MRRRSDGSNDNRATCENPAESLGALLGALAAEIAPVAPDLADVLSAWPTLPEALKVGIVAMVKAAAGMEGGKR